MKKVKILSEKRNHQADEAYKLVRTNLQFSGADKKVLAITSCTPNEGKSTVAYNLAQSMAESGKNVLLLDADLRKCVLMGKVETDEEIYGLTHYLSRQCNVNDIILRTDTPRLHVVFSGVVPPNPAELLSSDTFKELITMVRDIYDYVIVDTPPLGRVIDSAVIASSCDGAAIVVEAGNVSYRYVQEVKEQLEKSGCPILGVILNKVDYAKEGYGRYGKYGKYGKYGSYGQYGDY